MKYDSLLIHGLEPADNNHQAVVPDIALATTYVQPNVDTEQAFDYARGDNPTRHKLETLMAKLEGAKYGAAFASGLAAITAIFNLVKSGDKVLINANVYGGTYRHVTKLFHDRGVNYEFIADMNELADDDFTPDVRLIFMETPSNPLMRVIDIEKISTIAHRHQAKVVVDNTFLTSYLQRPLELGADAVVYSATKYIGGHADALAGIVVTSDEAINERIKLLQVATGGVLSPFDAYSLIRGVKTLALRMDRQTQNAHDLIDLFAKQGIKTYYPGSYSKAEATIAKRQAKDIGGLFSIELPAEYDLDQFVASLTMFPLAVSLGGVESLISRPYSMTHAAYGKEQLAKVNITPRLLRIAVGIENTSDLQADIAQALTKSKIN